MVIEFKCNKCGELEISSGDEMPIEIIKWDNNYVNPTYLNFNYCPVCGTKIQYEDSMKSLT